MTETWFNDDIEGELISIDGYVISRKDRQQSRGGGVSIYLSQHLHLKRRADLECPDMECLWLWLRPTRLPRPLTRIVVGVVYSPPDRNVEEGERLCGHITSTIDTIRYRNADAGIVILGDFNNLNIRNLMFSQNLKQAVQQPTRGNAILDLIVTNLHCFYESPNHHLTITPYGYQTDVIMSSTTIRV